MLHLEPEILEALNALLQDVRASVEVEVALSNGATERHERETLAGLGIEEVGLCCSLHEYLDAAGAFVTRHVNGVVLTIIGAEQYDERLREFAMHQTASGERADHFRQLSNVSTDPTLGRLLSDIHDTHVRSALWSEYRASQFAASRTLEFRTGSEAHSSGREATESVPPSPDETLPLATGGQWRDDPPGTAPTTRQQDSSDESESPGNSHRSPLTRDGYPIDDE